MTGSSGLDRRRLPSAIVILIGASWAISLAASSALADPTRSVRVDGSIPGVELAATIASGEAIQLNGAIVSGDVDLRRVRTVVAPIRCLDCELQGSFIAPDVIFERIVDLSGTRVLGDLDLRGAISRDAFLIRGDDDRVTQIDGWSDLALANFAASARFDGSTFAGPADFTGVSFAGPSSFADTYFVDRATFDRRF